MLTRGLYYWSFLNYRHQNLNCYTVIGGRRWHDSKVLNNGRGQDGGRVKDFTISSITDVTLRVI